MAIITSLVQIFGSLLRSCLFIPYQNSNNYHPRHHCNTAHHHLPNNMPKGRHLALQTVELQVRMCCTGCERVLFKYNFMKYYPGIDSIEVDLEMEKVTVMGYVDPHKVLKAVRRSGKRPEFWADKPLHDYKESYNYWRHGYNVGERHGSLNATTRGDDKVSNFFNDDNVNACCLM
ncbi:hypothetical protein MKX03_036464 [Papaver bracteatum]|nr:hypothetical protein MKX03_036464 [Papaver bracteatum]